MSDNYNNFLNVFQTKTENIQYMSSREIAELCEKRHDHVIRDIRKMLEQLGEMEDNPNLDSPKKSTTPNLGALKSYKENTYLDKKGEARAEILLNKNLTITLVAGYNVVLRNRIITRWEELENSNQNLTFKTPTNYEEAVDTAILALMEVRRIEKERKALAIENKEIKQTLAVVEPKADAFDLIGTNSDNYTISQTAKILGIKRDFLINFLINNRWVFRQNKKLTPYKYKIDNGELIFKVFQIDHNNKINCFTNLYITSKGLNTLSFIICKKAPSLEQIRRVK